MGVVLSAICKLIAGLAAVEGSLDGLTGFQLAQSTTTNYTNDTTSGEIRFVQNKPVVVIRANITAYTQGSNAGVTVTYWQEAAGNPMLHQLGVAGGNMEGKEVRLGVPSSVAWAEVLGATDLVIGVVLCSFRGVGRWGTEGFPGGGLLQCAWIDRVLFFIDGNNVDAEHLTIRSAVHLALERVGFHRLV